MLIIIVVNSSYFITVIIIIFIGKFYKMKLFAPGTSSFVDHQIVEFLFRLGKIVKENCTE